LHAGWGKKSHGEGVREKVPGKDIYIERGKRGSLEGAKREKRGDFGGEVDSEGGEMKSPEEDAR